MGFFGGTLIFTIGIPAPFVPQSFTMINLIFSWQTSDLGRNVLQRRISIRNYKRIPAETPCILYSVIFVPLVASWKMRLKAFQSLVNTANSVL